MKRRKKLILTIIIIAITALWFFISYAPIREYRNWPNYLGANDFEYKQPPFDSTKKTVVIIADHAGTEMFDLMAPFYLFNATEKANVYIVAEKKYPIIVRKGFFILPQFTFKEFDLSNIKPDVIIIPNLSAMDAKHQNPNIIDWIKKKYKPNTQMLAVCDGALTAAATGIYDGKPLTSHASDYEFIKKEYQNPAWINNISVTQSDNLYSTAGVSNAVEGSLTIINKIFGEEIMEKVKNNINYPYTQIKTEHQSVVITIGHKLSILKKVLFNKNRKIGILLHNGVNEFKLAAIMDTYHRTIPKSIESFILGDKVVITKYGLTMIPTGKNNTFELNEIHILDDVSFLENEEKFLDNLKIVKYDNLQNQYIIDYCLKRISNQYGTNYRDIVKISLDYN